MTAWPSFGATGRVKSQQYLQWGDWPNGIGIIRTIEVRHAWFDVLQAH